MEDIENNENQEEETYRCLLPTKSNGSDVGENIKSSCDSSIDITEKTQIIENDSKWHDYSIWLDCEINTSNRFYFMLANLLTSLALFFGVNLSRLDACQNISLTSFLYKTNQMIEYDNCTGTLE